MLKIKQKAKTTKYSYDHTTSKGQKRLMYESMGRYREGMFGAIPTREPGKDYGSDPIGDGTFRMVPSGDIVDYEERCRRLKK